MTQFTETYSKYYRKTTTSRGLTYNYLGLQPADGLKVTLLFLHGFPSLSHDWRYQIDYFHSRGFGVVVPDLLGYGGTDKPLDAAAYNLRLMAQDIIDILDHEKVERVVAVGHDWGSVLLSRIAIYHPARFLAYGWLAIGFTDPQSEIRPVDAILSWQKEHLGVELYAYQEFFLQPDAATIIEDNFESFADAAYPADPEFDKNVQTVKGAFAEWMTKGKRAPRAAWLFPEDLESLRNIVSNKGIDAPLNWYRAMLGGYNVDDDRKLAQQDIKIDKPAFFGAALQDHIGLADLNKAATAKVAINLTIEDFDAGHFLCLEKPDAVNRALDVWLATVV